MTFDLKKAVQQYTDLTLFGTPKSEVNQRQSEAVEILQNVLSQTSEIQQAFDQSVCEATNTIFHGWDYWSTGRKGKAVREALLHNQPADCSKPENNKQLTANLLNTAFAKLSYNDTFLLTSELQEFKNLYLTGKPQLADDLNYIVDVLPDLRKSRSLGLLVLSSIIPTQWLAYLSVFGGGFGFGFGSGKANQAFQKLSHIQDEKQRKEAVRELASGSFMMLFSLLSMLGGLKNFEWPSKNVLPLPTALSKAPLQPNRAILPEDQITPLRPININFSPNRTAHPPSYSTLGRVSETSPSNHYRSLQNLGANASRGDSIRNSTENRADNILQSVEYKFNGSNPLKFKAEFTPIQTYPVAPLSTPAELGDRVSMPILSPFVPLDYNGEYVSHASLLNLKGIENYLTQLLTRLSHSLSLSMSTSGTTHNSYAANLEKIRGNEDEDERYPALYYLVRDLKSLEGINDPNTLFNRIAVLLGLDPEKFGEEDWNEQDWSTVAPGMTSEQVKNIIRHSEKSFDSSHANNSLTKLFQNLFKGDFVNGISSLMARVKKLPIPEGDREFLINDLNKINKDYVECRVKNEYLILGQLEAIARLMIFFPKALRFLLEDIQATPQDDNSVNIIAKFYRVTPGIEQYLESNQDFSPYDLTPTFTDAIREVNLGETEYILSMNLRNVDYTRDVLSPYIQVGSSYWGHEYLISIKILPDNKGVEVVLLPPSSNPYHLYEILPDDSIKPILLEESNRLVIPKLGYPGQTVERTFVTPLAPGKSYQLGPFRFTIPSVENLKGESLPIAPTFLSETEIAAALRERKIDETYIRRAFEVYSRLSSPQGDYVIIDHGSDQYNQIEFMPIGKANPSMAIVGYFNSSIHKDKISTDLNKELVQDTERLIKETQNIEYSDGTHASFDKNTQLEHVRKALESFSFLDINSLVLIQDRGNYFAQIDYLNSKPIKNPNEKQTAYLIIPLERLSVLELGSIWRAVDYKTVYPPEADDINSALYYYYANHSLNPKDKRYGYVLFTLQQNLTDLNYRMHSVTASSGLWGTMNITSSIRGVIGNYYLNIVGGPFINRGSQWSDFSPELREVILKSFPREVIVLSIYTRIAREIKKDLENQLSLRSRYISFVADWELVPSTIQQEVLERLPETMRQHWLQMIDSQKPKPLCETPSLNQSG